MLQGGTLISEEEVEVGYLTLAPSEKWAVEGEGIKYFDADALTAFCANIRHPSMTEGFILPCLSGGSYEKFWLFYCTAKLGTVLKAGPCKAFSCYWPDLVEETSAEYTLLTNSPDEVTKVNAIKLEDGTPLYHTFHQQIEEGQKYMAPPLFIQAISLVINRTMNMVAYWQVFFVNWVADNQETKASCMLLNVVTQSQQCSVCLKSRMVIQTLDSTQAQFYGTH